jgi:hypothetical protein
VNHQTTSRFWSFYYALPLEIQELANKQHALLEQNPKHPSLHFKEVGKQLWSVRVNDSYRALALSVPTGFLWFWIGLHDEYERLIKRH